MRRAEKGVRINGIRRYYRRWIPCHVHQGVQELFDGPDLCCGLAAFPGLSAYRPSRPFGLPGLPGLRAFPAYQKYGKGSAYRRSPERDGVNRRNGAFVAAKRAVIGCEVRRVGAEPGIWQKWGAGKGTNALSGVGYSHKSLGRGLNLRYQTIPCFTLSRDSCWSNASSFSSSRST